MGGLCGEVTFDGSPVSRRGSVCAAPWRADCGTCPVGAGRARTGRDPRTGVLGYSGASRYPVDLTFDVGFRFDTRVGVFQVGFSTLLGFIQL